MVAPSRSAELLDRIAATLGVPVAAFTAADPTPAADPAPAALIAELVFDPNGRRLAAAFVRLGPNTRKAFADAAEALCAGGAAKRQQNPEGRS